MIKAALYSVSVGILFTVAAGAQSTAAGPMKPEDIITRIGQYPESLPLVVLQNFSRFQFDKLDAGTRSGFVQDKEQSSAVDRKSVPIEASFLAAKKQLLPATTLQSKSLAIDSNGNPIARLRLSVSNPIISPPHQKIDKVANLALDRGLAVLLRNDITADQIQTFLASSVPKTFPTPDVATAFINNSLQFFQGALWTDPEFQSLPPTSQAELLQMLHKQLKAKSDAGMTSSQIVNSIDQVRQNLQTAQLSVTQSVKNIDAVRDAVHKIGSQETNLSSTLLDHQRNFVNEVKGFETQVQSAANSLKGMASGMRQSLAANPPVAGMDQIGQYINKYSSTMNQVQLGAQVLNTLSSDKLPTEDLIGLASKSLPQLPPPVSSLIGGLNSLLNHQADIAGKVTSLLSDGNGIVNQLSNSIGGIFPDVLGDSSNEIGNIAGSLLGGNYLNVASAIPGLGGLIGGFGGAGQTQAILSKLAEMDKKLDDLLEGQKQILAGINEVNQNVLQLTKLVIQQHQETMAQLENIQKDLLINRQIELDILGQPLSDCYNVIPPPRRTAMPAGPIQIGNSDSRDYQALLWSSFKTYNEQALWLNTNLGSFERCQSYLRSTLLNSRSGLPLLLRFDVNQTQARIADLKQYLESYVQPHMKALEKYFPLNTTYGAAAASVVNPSISTSDLEVKMASITANSMIDGSNFILPGTLPTSEAPALTLVKTDRLVEAADLAVAILPVWALINMVPQPEGTARIALIDESKATNPAWFTPDLMQNLKNVLDPGLNTLLVFLNSAISQQALLGGDILIPSQAKDISSGRAEDWLVSNQMLRRNLALFTMKQRMKAAKTNAFVYSVASTLTIKCPADVPAGQQCFDASLLNETLKDPSGNLPPLVFKRRNMLVNGNLDTTPSCGGATVPDGGWFIQLADNVCQPVPSPEELTADQLVLTAECIDLIRVRDSVLDLIASMRFRDRQNKDATDTLTLLMAGSSN